MRHRLSTQEKKKKGEKQRKRRRVRASGGGVGIPRSSQDPILSAHFLSLLGMRNLRKRREVEEA